MSLVEKHIAEQLVDLRHQASLGSDYCKITVAIDALERQLQAEQRHRVQVANLAADIAALSAQAIEAQR